MGRAVHEASSAEDLQSAAGPFERADFTSNTFWDWQLNHVGQVYGRWTSLRVRDDVQGVSATLVPAELRPGNIIEEHLDDIKDNRAKAGSGLEASDKFAPA